jgi:dephospho-CoA kinase
LIIGLTGGIGSGKSTVGALFGAMGVPVLDTDQVARELVRPGCSALRRIVEEFGPGLLDRTGALDRAALRGIVFADPVRRRALEAILHPLIRAHVEEWIGGLSACYCVLLVPLLLESGWSDLVDRIAVVDLPETLQIRRAMDRDGLTASDVEAIMRAQVSREQRLARAHDVISNDLDMCHLRDQVEKLHRAYLDLGAQRRHTTSSHT